MTGPSVQHLNRAKIRRLLAAVGSVPGDERATPEAAVYDWRDPHSFNEDQRNRLAAMMSQVAVLIAEAFTHFYRDEFSVALTSITQHFAADLYRRTDIEQSRCLAFGAEQGRPCGFLAIAKATALKWVTRLLGDSESDGDPGRTLSSLEESLLADLGTTMVDSFLASLRPSHDLHPEKEIVDGPPSIQFELTEEICQITFEIRQADSEESDRALFVLPCGMLAPLVGKEPAKTAPASAEDLSRVLTEHLHRMPVTVTAVLASTRLGFAELVNLQRDDVLLLDKTIDEPVELLLDGRVVFRGRPARSDGRYAVVLTPSADGPAQEKAAPASTH